MATTEEKIIKNYRLAPDLVERIDRAAKAEDISQTTLVKQAIQEKVAKIEKKLCLPIDK